MKKIILLATVFFAVQSFAQQKHPSFMQQGNIYEVNIRQYTPEGTFNAFAKHIPRLKKMGVQTLWLMPIQPISNWVAKGLWVPIMLLRITQQSILSLGP
jgi:1,4-alpha-glucan branching enzyme